MPGKVSVGGSWLVPVPGWGCMGNSVSGLQREWWSQGPPGTTMLKRAGGLYPGAQLCWDAAPRLIFSQNNPQITRRRKQNIHKCSQIDEEEIYNYMGILPLFFFLLKKVAQRQILLNMSLQKHTFTKAKSICKHRNKDAYA